MPLALKYEVTNGGLATTAALTEADKPIRFTKLAIGKGAYNAGYRPVGNETALVDEFARFGISNLSREGRVLFLEAMYDGNAQGWVREVGLFIESTNGSEVLFALWSDPAFNIGYKAIGVPFIFMETVELSRIPTSAISVTAQAPSLQLLFVTPIIDQSAEIVRLQRRAVESEVIRLTPTIESHFFY